MRLIWTFLLISLFCLLNSGAIVLSTALSPTSTTPDVEYGLLFSSDSYDEPGLFWVRADGSERARIVSYSALSSRYNMNIYDSSLLPGGQHLMLNATRRYRISEMFLFDPTQSDIQHVTTDSGYAFAAAWSPDRTKFIYHPNPVSPYWEEIHMVDVVTGASHVLASTQDVERLYRPVPVAVRSFGNAAWSPDGKTIVVDFWRQHFNAPYFGPRSIVQIDVDEARLSNMIAIEDTASNPIWTPDNNLIFVCGDEGYGRSAKLCLFDMRRRLSTPLIDLSRFFPDGIDQADEIDLADNGELLIYCQFRCVPDRSVLYILNLNSGEYRELLAATGIRGRHFEWSPRPEFPALNLIADR